MIYVCEMKPLDRMCPDRGSQRLTTLVDAWLGVPLTAGLLLYQAGLKLPRSPDPELGHADSQGGKMF